MIYSTYMYMAIMRGSSLFWIKVNPHVFIEIDGNDEALASGRDIPCKYSSVYSSVMGRVRDCSFEVTLDEKPMVSQGTDEAS